MAVGQFCVLYKSCFLNVTDECVVFIACYSSCQIVKAVITLHTGVAGVAIQYCSGDDTAFSSKLLFKERYSSSVMGDNAGCRPIAPLKVDLEIPNAKLQQ